MGRKKIYQTEEEKKQAQREHGLRYYYRRKALKQALEQPHQEGDNESIKVKVAEFSKRLGQIDEEITFKTKADGKLLKKRS